MRRFILVSLVCLAFVTNILAQEEQQKSLDEIAQDMSNPTLPLMNFGMFYEYQGFVGDLNGASDQSVSMFALQPPLPFPMANGKNLLIRPLIPFLFSQPVYKNGEFESAGGVNMGDIGLDVLYAGTKNGIMKGFGLIANIPTATSSDIKGEWAVGPSVLLGAIKTYGVFVLILNQSFELSGEDKNSKLGGQYVMAFSFGKGWQFVSSPPFSYNWDTKDFTLPVGGGPFKTVIMGSTPVKLGLQAYYFASSPDAFGQKWSLRFSITPSLKRPW